MRLRECPRVRASECPAATLGRSPPKRAPPVGGSTIGSTVVGGSTLCATGQSGPVERAEEKDGPPRDADRQRPDRAAACYLAGGPEGCHRNKPHLDSGRSALTRHVDV